jgi:hypothetical protein
VAQARRAKPRRSRALVSLLVAAIALLVGGVVATLLFWPNALTATIRPEQTPSTDAETSPTPTAETTSVATATPSATPSRSATPSPTVTPASRAAISAMNACRDRVQVADNVLDKGRTGVRHWEAHVDAERRAEAGAISIEKRQQIFKATRLKGPEDQKRYADALRAYDKVKDASCGKTTGADAKVTATLARCQQRVKAQDPAMRTAAAAMGDWKRHLADMQRSRVQHNSDAQQVWINTYKAAPPNINAYEKAARAFKKAPSC